ncbi:hypothetical protein [Pantoea agglomerans]|uniref:Uncharacterized protein n=1 Tax=Enterobacter agglomerans TaxID=549 RepID=A0ACC5RLT9_ENTAG|nr:hypothetical protein [Pantoea agglomerans]MBK4725650.1 hypothetical protein [Pantoea agglomerans]
MAGVNKTHLTETYKETIDGFDLDEYVLQERLTDATEEGGLFGIRFG